LAEKDSPEQQTERRGFMAGLAAAGVALMGGAAGFIGAGFLYPIEKKKQPPLFVCLESALPYGEPLEIKAPDGRNALVMRQPGGGVEVIGTVCSHLGCTVYYRPEKKIFECPCHQGVFDNQGRPVSGPPERPLDRYPAMVRDGKVFVDFS